MDEEDERDVGGAVERAIALANLDGVEVAAGLQPLFDVAQPVGRQRLTERDAGEPDDLVIAYVGVAVNANLRDHLGLGIALRHERAGL